MSDDSNDDIEGLEPKKLFREAVGDVSGDPDAARREAEDEQRVRAEIEKRLPDLEILDLLGRGGMGYVYRARQKKLDRIVALKVIAPDPEKRSDFASRFAREAQALALLNHPNLVTVYDYGQDGDFGWLLMEYVEGSNLRDLIRGGKLEPAEALALIPRICDALQFAHDRGVVHRDVKPENILVDRQGGVKIADFGLAKLIGSPTALVSLTGTQQVLGTFRYMAPEQLDRPLDVDHRADIYSLGVVFYEMLTGEIPMGRFDPPSRHSTASTEVDDVVLRALERAPERRYQRASEVKSDLESLKHGDDRRADAGTAAAAPTKPRISFLAIASVAVIPIYWMSFLPAMIAMADWASSSGNETTADPQLRASFAGFVIGIFGLFGFALMIVGSVMGFLALRRIRIAWPRSYGAGAAVVGAWAAPLLFLNFFIMGMSSGITPTGPGIVMPFLLALDVTFLVWARRRFLRGCRATQAES